MTVLSQGLVNSLALCHNTVQRDLDGINTLPKMVLIYYVNDIMLIGHNEQEVTSKLEALVKHRHSKV